MKLTKLLILSIIILLGYGCKNSNNCVNNVINELKIKPSIKIAIIRDTIRGRDIPYDTLNNRIGLLELDDHQNMLLTRKLWYFDSTSAIQYFRAYFYNIQERWKGIATIALFTQSDYGDLMFLVNMKDTNFISSIDCGEDDIGDVVESLADKEIIAGYNRWFEFHEDSVYKIQTKVIEYNYYDARPKMQTKADSITTIYFTNPKGEFKIIKNDTVLFNQTVH